MDKDELLAVLEEQGGDVEAWQTAVELGRMLGEEAGVCCDSLARVIMATYKILAEKEEVTK